MEKQQNSSRLLLAMDIDGTSVGNDCRLGRRTAEALKRFREAGHIICFDSGRTAFDMPNMCGDERAADYLITNTGGCLVRLEDNRVLAQHRAKPEDIRQLIDACVGTQCVLYLITSRYVAVNRITPGVLDYAQWAGFEPRIYSSADEIDLDDVDGMMASTDISVVFRAIEEKALEFDYVYSEPEAIDIMPRGINKWSGLQELCRFTGIPEENTIAVGNYMNDSHMVCSAGLGVAVGDAQPELKQLADIVLCADHNHDPIADLIDGILAGDYDARMAGKEL